MCRPATIPRFALDAPEQLPDYELIIVGSDEVWNSRHPWYGGWPIFFGAGLRSGRLASYAASFGSHDASEGLDGWWADNLRNFHALSVRDHNSKRIVSDALGVEPELVLDPCLQFPPEAGAESPSTDGGYLAVYGHSFPDWFTAAIGRWARQHGYPIVSIGYLNDWADEQRIDACPKEFVQLIAGSAAVATNFFHGCVFALVHARPFVSTLGPTRFST